MGYNGAGVYTLPPGSIVSDGTSADAADLNTPLEDVEDSLNLVHLSDGRKAAEANWPMGGFKLTGMANGSAATDSATLSQVQTGVVAHAATVGGTADAITITFSPANTAWTSKEIIRWTSGGANTVTAPTISKDAGSTTKTIKKGAGAALAVGDTGASGYICIGVYDGTDVILINPASGAFGGATNAEALAVTSTSKFITPSNLAAFHGKGSDIASAGTITIGDGGYFDVTGTTSITDIDLTVDFNGREFELQFDGALTLTHGSALILPGASDIVTSAGDIARFRSEGSDVVRLVGYQYAAGLGGVTRVSGDSGAAGKFETWQTLTSDYTNATGSDTTVFTTTGVGAGVWNFEYVSIVQTDNSSARPAFTVSHSGTVTEFLSGLLFTSTGTTATTGIADAEVNAQGTATQIVEGSVTNTSGSPVRVPIGFNTLNTDYEIRVKGTAVVTATGSLTLAAHRGPTAGTITIKDGSHLVLRKIS